MSSAFFLAAFLSFFRRAAAVNITLSSRLFSDGECRRQFRQVPQGPVELDTCQYGQGAHVLYTCVNDSHLRLTLNLAGEDCTKGRFTYEADLTNGECAALRPLGFASGIWTWTGGCGAAAAAPLEAEEVKESAPALAGAATPCCQGACPAGQEKYWSLASGIFGGRHCGECCLEPSKYPRFHFFEKNLTKAVNTVTPCHDFGYTAYDSTPTHGFGPLSITLDLYSEPKAAPTPCCRGACPAGEEKYWSLASGVFGGEHCGECCLDPSKYPLFHLFERNLTKAERTVTPCHDFGYTVYDSTPTHGLGPVSITLDLYDQPKAEETILV